MKITTWNVNSLKVRLDHVIAWLERNPVDALCLQELKLTDDKFPEEALAVAGYHSYFLGQKTYNGVAVLVKNTHPAVAGDITRNIPGFDDPQQRLIGVTVSGVRVISGYFPNGQAPGTDKFAYKLRWLAALEAWLATELQRHPALVLAGDFNIAPEDRDVHDPAKWVGQNLVSQDERDAFARLVRLGLVDSYRRFEQPEKQFTWWDYRMGAFRRNAGLRIDHLLLSAPLADACTGCWIDTLPRQWEQPSDHTPVTVEIVRP